jgi:putative tricarboxylic transport membrane protein
MARVGSEGDEGGQPGTGRRRELAVAGVLVGFAVLVVALSLRIPPGVETDPLGPRLFPLGLGAAIGLCGLLLAADALGLTPASGAATALVEQGGGEGSPASFAPGRLAATALATAVYVALFEPLGYLSATPAYVGAILLIQRGVTPRAFLTAALLLPAVFYAAFRFGLLIPLPAGVLEGWLPW